MSMKCRGNYTIKGDGTQTLVNELNALYKGVEKHSYTSSAGVNVYDKYLDLTPLLGEQWEGRVVVSGGHLAPDGNFVDDLVPDRFWVQLCENEWPLVVKDGQVAFYAATKWAPPIVALTVLSKVCPTVEVTLGYSLECDRWSGGRTLLFKKGTVLQVQYEHFVLAEQGQPISHWVVTCPDSTIKLIKETGVKLLDDDEKETPPDKEVMVAVMDADIATVMGMEGVQTPCRTR